MKKILQFLCHRVVVVACLIFLQVLILMFMILRFRDYFVHFYAFCVLLSTLVLLYIINNKSNPAYKIAWIIPILLFPFFGGLFYVMFGRSRLSKRTIRKMYSLANNFHNTMEANGSTLSQIAQESLDAANQSRYIQNYAGSPAFQHTSTEYLPLGEVKFERMVEELKKARHYIFLEYFIIQEGKMWNTILDILVEKVKEGVDVRVIYDDIGCIMTLPNNYKAHLESLGIKCCVFNPFIPILSMKLNNRDHRKICVIDGHTGFTGGINLADEYINAYEKHGHWKDVAILLKGEAVWSLTVMFLSMWDYILNIREDYEKYRPNVYLDTLPPSDGYVQPYMDNPIDQEAIGETVYLNMINKAKRYVYINTPYLIISNEMITALTSAAKEGVDVRIVTPHIADKWYVHALTRAHYEILVEAGVKIYEYTPGFVHAKTFVADDEYGIVGTINLDFRSLYLHFEDAVWLFRTKSVLAIRDDYLKTLEVCQQITLASCRSVSWYQKIFRSILRLFAPLM